MCPEREHQPVLAQRKRRTNGVITRMRFREHALHPLGAPGHRASEDLRHRQEDGMLRERMYANAETASDIRRDNADGLFWDAQEELGQFPPECMNSLSGCDERPSSTLLI